MKKGLLTDVGGLWGQFENSAASELGDFTTSRRVLRISVLAVLIGVVSSGIAFVLLRLIAFFTNLFFFQKFSQGILYRRVAAKTVELVNFSELSH